MQINNSETVLMAPGTPLLFAVIGNPVTHSLSPRIHQRFAEQSSRNISYQKISATPLTFEKEVHDFFENGGSGLSVTAPFKERAFALATVKQPRALKAKSANTLWLQAGQLCADNTDGVGFLQDLTSFFCLTKKKVFILGTGGAARGIIATLLSTDIASLTVAGRSQEKLNGLKQDFPSLEPQLLDTSIESLSAHTVSVSCDTQPLRFDLVINTIPSHLFASPQTRLNLHFSPHTYYYDLGYALPGEETPFVQRVKRQGYQARNGIGMLIQQAAEAYFLWHGIRPATSTFLL